jgi:hypothetical protein
MEPGGNAYDASQIGLRYVGLAVPEHDWHPVELLRVLVEICSTSPFRRSARFTSGLHRHISVGLAAARLGERGFNVDELVRCAFREMYVGEFIRLSARVSFDRANGTTLSTPLEALGAEVCDRMGAPAVGATFSSYLNQIVEHSEVAPFGRKAAGWLQVAELSEILTWDIPSPSLWASVTELDSASIACESQWLADRFLLTYLSDWHTASLHDEYRWARGERTSGVAIEDLSLRSIPTDHLNAEIASRAVVGGARDPRALLSTGVDLLLRGEHEQAVAFFQGALTVQPSSWVRNCLAFCLIPSDPDAAADIFQDLLNDGHEPHLVYANLAAVERLWGNISAAHHFARAGLALIDEQDRRTAYLWGFEDSLPTLMENVVIRDYLRFVLSWDS